MSEARRKLSREEIAEMIEVSGWYRSGSTPMEMRFATSTCPRNTSASASLGTIFTRFSKVLLRQAGGIVAARSSKYAVTSS